MRYAIWSFVVALMCSAVLSSNRDARAEIDQGAAGFYPWSGYWWQHASGGLTGPLSRYDQAFGTRAAAWEHKFHVSRRVPQWYGHCHAWSAASVSEKEPKSRQSANSVAFGVGDQKGLLSACHASDVANVYGDRFGDGVGNEVRQDLNPVAFWRVLQMYVKQRKLPIIADLEPGEEVWNYPVCSYRVDYQPGTRGWHEAKLVIMTVDNDVHPNYVGHKTALHRYSFRFVLRNGAPVIDGAHWVGRSAEQHPDFAWYPYVAVTENPEVDLAQVSRVVGYPVGGSNPTVDGGSSPSESEPTTDPSPPPQAEREPATELSPPPQADREFPAAVSVDFADMLSADELLSLVANKTSHFRLDIFTDGGDGARFRAGDRIRVTAESNQPGFLYLFDIGPAGDMRLVFPLPGDDNRIAANQPREIPPQGERPWLRADGTGQHHLKGIVTSRRVRLTGFGATASGDAATGPQEPAEQTDKQDKDKEKQPKKDPAAAVQSRSEAQPAEQKSDAEKPPLKQQKKDESTLPSQEKTEEGAEEPASQELEPQQLRIYPTALRQIRNDLLAFFSKGQEFDEKATDKAGRFAQDRCDYFVLPAPGLKTDRKGPTQTSSRTQASEN